MLLDRVVITGIGLVSPFGKGVRPLIDGIINKRSAVLYMREWEQYAGLRSHVAAPAPLSDDKKIPRKKRRSMSPMSIFAVQASEEAIADSGIAFSKLNSGRIGSIVGSTMGSSQAINQAFETILPHKDIGDITSTLFFKCMSHTAAMNVAQYFGLTGYTLATAAACASSLQAIGVGYNLIKTKYQDIILCGGTEELHPTVTGSLDALYATSTAFNHCPHKTPRPFDANRDGLVCGEGSGIVVLESYEHALARNAKIYAEIIGYNTSSSGEHISQSKKESIVYCIKQALSDAKVGPEKVDYINAHATGTTQGDKEEAEAIKEIFGSTVPISSLKGYIGHTLGASGVIELIASLMMMEKGVIYPGLNLDNVAPDCSGIYHVLRPTEKKIEIILKNCFAFGGINAALICKKIEI